VTWGCSSSLSKLWFSGAYCRYWFTAGRDKVSASCQTKIKRNAKQIWSCISWCDLTTAIYTKRQGAEFFARGSFWAVSPMASRIWLLRLRVGRRIAPSSNSETNLMSAVMRSIGVRLAALAIAVRSRTALNSSALHNADYGSGSQRGVDSRTGRLPRYGRRVLETGPRRFRSKLMTQLYKLKSSLERGDWQPLLRDLDSLADNDCSRTLWSIFNPGADLVELSASTTTCRYALGGRCCLQMV